MRIIDLFEETFRALLSNRSRSGLTILGIVIGIASVIAMISIGQGASGSIESTIQGLGSNLLTIMPGFSSRQNSGFVSQGRGSAMTLTREDAESLIKINGVAYVSPESSRRFQIVSPVGKNTNSSVMGVLSDYLPVRNLSLAEGNFISDAQDQSLAKVVVLGPTVSSDLFGEEGAVGKTVRINKIGFKVIGILETKGGSSFSSSDEMAFVPLSVMQKILFGSDNLSTIAISVESKDQMSLVKEEAISIMAQNHGVDPENPDFSIISQEDILGALSQVTNTFTIFLASVAGISLVVGGIGIMNMMLTTVTERTREIGLRKAVGAKKKDIINQFLAEAVALTFLGGVFGVILGWLVSILISNLAGINTSVSLAAVALAFCVSAAIGIVFGYYPAKRAASLNPIEALRYE